MPTVAVKRDQLFKDLGQTFTDEQFDTLCFEFGIELDDITTEVEIASKNERGLIASDAKLSEEIIYKIEVPANRYDLLCLEGLVLALRIFLKKSLFPDFKVIRPSSDKLLKLVRHKETDGIRPFVVAAVLRGITFDPIRYASFIDLQDKLHQNIGRRRTLVAIGTHDLDTIQGPFSYEARPQKDITFKALSEDRERNVVDLFHYYEHEKPNCHLKPYLAITQNAPLHPVIYDKNRVVLSLPPIINGEHSKISLNTKNVLIECTGTDLTKLKITLNTVIAMFSGYCSSPYTVEAVEVIDQVTSQSVFYPDLSSTPFTANVDYINKGIGVNIPGPKMAEILTRMQLPATFNESKNELSVKAPITRSDIMHPCDILEDVAIAYGYNNIPKTLPKSVTIGRQQTLNKFSDLLREGISQAGFTEVLTWALIAEEENFKWLLRPDDGKTAVKIANPKTRDFQLVRSSLLPGLLKTLSSNKGQLSLPVRLFELSDIMLLDDTDSKTNDVGARNQRRAGAIICGMNSGFEVVHGLLDRIMMLNNIAHDITYKTEQAKKEEDLKQALAAAKAKADKEKKAAAQTNKKGAKGTPAPTTTATEEKQKQQQDDEDEQEEITVSSSSMPPRAFYSLRSSTNPSYFPGQRGDIYVNDTCIGTIGIIHPEVLTNFKIDHPCAAFEINVEIFL